MANLFLFDTNLNVSKAYSELLHDIKNRSRFFRIVKTNDLYEIFLNIVLSLLNNQNVTLIDPEMDWKSSLNFSNDINCENKNGIKFNSIDAVIYFILNNSLGSITLLTSGTTGEPKKVTHQIDNILRDTKISKRYENNVWGFCYNPTHIAGILVFFQAFLNKNPIINLYRLSRGEILKLIDEFKITHLSATSTFYRLLLPIEKKHLSIISITNGGEKFDQKLFERLRDAFPNAKFVNIYASTEAGAILKSKDDIFEIKDEYVDFVKIENNELLISEKILGKSKELTIKNGWYNTGDIIEIISVNPLKFKIIGRKEDIVNVGGEKVSVIEVEEIINSHPLVKNCKVYPIRNSVIGNVLGADIQLIDNKLTENELVQYLSEKLPRFKIPKFINFVEELNLTRTGKLKRV